MGMILGVLIAAPRNTRKTRSCNAHSSRKGKLPWTALWHSGRTLQHQDMLEHIEHMPEAVLWALDPGFATVRAAETPSCR
jgi:hypothetical protein